MGVFSCGALYHVPFHPTSWEKASDLPLEGSKVLGYRLLIALGSRPCEWPLKAMRGVEKRNGDTVSVYLRVYLSDCLVDGFN